MTKKVYLFGMNGRMGSELQKIIKSSKNFEFIGGFDRKNPSKKPSIDPDLVIDFSLPDSLDSLCEFMKGRSCPLVSGTTGFSTKQFNTFKTLSKTNPVFWAANMSFGVYLMSKLVENLSLYSKNYSLHIEETHHIHKKDKPSGTAILIENAAKKITKDLKETQSIREGEVFGIHKFIAQSPLESIEIRHEAFERGLFAQGALDIGLWLSRQVPGFYEMENYFQNQI